MHKARVVMNKLLTSDQAAYAPKASGLLTASWTLYFRMATSAAAMPRHTTRGAGAGPRHGIAGERGDDHQKRNSPDRMESSTRVRTELGCSFQMCWAEFSG